MDRIEIWGTFSVRDHLRPRPFVTDVLLYDRLMIPRPPRLEEEVDADGRPAPDRGEEYARWRRHWDPDRQLELLEILRDGNLVVELPWGRQARSQWAELYEGAADEGAEARIGDARAEILEATRYEIDAAKLQSPDDAPYLATAGLISMYLSGAVQNDVARNLVALTKTPGVEIRPVIAYASYLEFVNEQLLLERAPEAEAAAAPGPEPAVGYGMVGWEIEVPEDPDQKDEDLLRAAVRLASRKDLREKRQHFHAQLRQLAEGGVDPGDAVAHMEKLLEGYRDIVRGSGIRTVARWVAEAIPLVAPLAGFAGPVGGVAGGVAQAGAPPITRWLLPKREPDARVLPAALVHDVRNFLRRA